MVTAIGEGVTRFAPGDAVIGFPGVRLGAHAEFCVMREDAALIHRPANWSDAQASALAFGGTTALHFLRDKGELQSGERVLILIGGGGVGGRADGPSLGRACDGGETGVNGFRKEAANSPTSRAISRSADQFNIQTIRASSQEELARFC